MALTYPLFLLALLALAIPVIIHLFQFRRYKTLYFPDITLLKSVQQETTSRSRLKHLLILLCRLLAITALVLAFCQPFVPGKNTGKQRSNMVSVYVDNSFSMQGQNENGPQLAAAKQMAFEIARSYPAGTQFQLITNDFQGSQQMLYSQDDFIRKLDEVDISPNVHTLGQVVARQAEVLGSDSLSQAVYWISDFQENVVDAAMSLPAAYNYRIVPVTAQAVGNVSIDSVWFEEPVQRVNTEHLLWYRVSNYSDEARVNIPLTMSLDGQTKGVMGVSLAPRRQLDTFFNITTTVPGWHQGEIAMEDYPVVFDDRFHFAFQSRAVFTVTELFEGAGEKIGPFEKLFAKDEFIDWAKVPAGNPDFGRLRESGLVIINGVKEISSGLVSELVHLMEEGGNILLVPSNEINLESWNAMLANFGNGSIGPLDTSRLQATAIEQNHPLYKGVFSEWPDNVNLPFVQQHYPVRGGRDIMVLANGDPLVMDFPSESGSVYMVTAPVGPETGNFYKHALFVPTVYNMAITGGQSQKIFHWLGAEPFTIASSFRGNQENIRIAQMGTGAEFIPETRYGSSLVHFFSHGQASGPGMYEILAGDSLLALMALNYDREESQMGETALDSLQLVMSEAGVSFGLLNASEPETVSAEIQALDLGTELWPYFIMAALLFFILEIVFLKLNL